MDDCLYGIFASLGADTSVFKPFGEMYALVSAGNKTANEPTGAEIMNGVKAKLMSMTAPSDGGEKH